MKALFPLPLIYDGNESRFLQRDGARFAAELNRQGHTGIKLIIDDGSQYPKPESPLLDIATWEEWTSPDYWKSTNSDLVLLYGGTSKKLLPVAKAIKKAGIPLFLKMDVSMGALPYWHTDFWRLLRTVYHHTHQNHNMVFSTAKSIAVRLKEMFSIGKRWLPEYFSLFEVITVESDYALENLKSWLSHRGFSHLADRVKLLPHPIPDSFTFDPNLHVKNKTIIAVAQNWTNPLKGGKLLANAIARVLVQRTDYSAVIIGGGSDAIINRVKKKNTSLSSRLTTFPKIDSDKTKDLYCSAQILITTSGSEGWPLVVSEAACCGCSIVFPPELKYLQCFEKSRGGTMAKWRNTKQLSLALLAECEAWDTSERSPVETSQYWGKLCHTSNLVNTLMSWTRSEQADPCPTEEITFCRQRCVPLNRLILHANLPHRKRLPLLKLIVAYAKILSLVRSSRRLTLLLLN